MGRQFYSRASLVDVNRVYAQNRAHPCRLTKLNGYAPKDLDRRRKGDENFAVGNVAKRLDLLPIVEIAPDQSDDAKKIAANSNTWRPRESLIISPGTMPSDARVPGIASFGRRRAQALAELLQVVGHGQMGDELHTLVAKLAREPDAHRPAVAHGKIVAIHPVSEE